MCKSNKTIRCPLRHASTGITEPCLKDECAWWDDRNDRCVVFEIS